MKCFLLLFIFLFGFSILIAEKTTENPAFSAETTVSSNSIAIDEQVTLHVILKYPTNFHPNIELMKRRLLTYSGFHEAPFTLVNTIISSPQMSGETLTQQLEFVLSPQRSGKHDLTFRLIPFFSESKNEEKVEIASDIFTINVTSPEVDVNLQSLIEPPMALSKELPITLSQANRMAYLTNPQLLDAEAENNAAFMKNKFFPWLPLISALAVILVIMLIRLLPSETIHEKIEPQIKEKNEFEIKEVLRKLSLTSPKETNEIQESIVYLDFLLRSYLLNKYEFPAFSFTTQELADKLETLEDLTPSLKEGMNNAFEKADRIKFAKYIPSSNDLQDLLKTAKQLSETGI